MGRTASGVTIPEAQELTWDDDYFDKDDDVVAVFDFDYEKIEEFEVEVCKAMLMFPPFLICGSLCCVPCYYKQNIEWKVYAQHVAVTDDGIKYVTEKQKAFCGFDFQDQGKKSKTVPFDKITDCDVTEPAGATCICVDNVLFTLNVDTASSGGGGDGVPAHELSLAGLKKAEEMKKLVWAMKRHISQGGGKVGPRHSAGGVALPSSLPPYTSAPEVVSGMDRGDTTNAILREIRDELRQMNAHLRSQR